MNAPGPPGFQFRTVSPIRIAIGWGDVADSAGGFMGSGGADVTAKMLRPSPPPETSRPRWPQPSCDSIGSDSEGSAFSKCGCPAVCCDVFGPPRSGRRNPTRGSPPTISFFARRELSPRLGRGCINYLVFLGGAGPPHSRFGLPCSVCDGCLPCARCGLLLTRRGPEIQENCSC